MDGIIVLRVIVITMKPRLIFGLLLSLTITDGPVLFLSDNVTLLVPVNLVTRPNRPPALEGVSLGRARLLGMSTLNLLSLLATPSCLGVSVSSVMASLAPRAIRHTAIYSGLGAGWDSDDTTQSPEMKSMYVR